MRRWCFHIEKIGQMNHSYMRRPESRQPPHTVTHQNWHIVKKDSIHSKDQSKFDTKNVKTDIWESFSRIINQHIAQLSLVLVSCSLTKGSVTVYMVSCFVQWSWLIPLSCKRWGRLHMRCRHNQGILSCIFTKDTQA